jgi:glycosyltransferase involved in cell wall biosynthesis
MRIGIDARELMGHPTGVGRYLAEVLREWSLPGAGVVGRHEIALYGPTPLGARFESAAFTLGARIVVLPGSGGTWWEQVTLARAANRDALGVFFAPAYTAPLRLRCPVVSAIHDVSFFAHPEWFRWREGLRRRLITRSSARRSAAVLTLSAFSRGEIEKHVGIPAGRVRVIPCGPGTPAWLDPRPGPAGAAAPGSAREPLVLYVGSVFNRRRVPDLIAAFPAVTAAVPGARLEIVGENRTHPFQDIEGLARATGLGDRIRVRAYVSESELADAFRHASAFVFLSEYEGFGLTPLEALSCGVPLVLLDTAVAREVCAPAARWVAPGDADGLSGAIISLLRDPEARRAALAPAGQVLARYSWARTARQTLDALESAGR